MKSRAAQKVAIAYPYPHTVSARFHHSLVNLLVTDAKGNRRVIDGAFIANSSGANITNARNEICKAFLDDLPGVDWLLFIDTDMTFEPDLVERLLESAHPEKCPILGALCFSLQRGDEWAPTIYVLRDDGLIGRLPDYPRDQLVPGVMTGTGCVLIHRSVLEKFRDSGKFPAAYPWFQETHVKHLPVGEDITFCIRAGALGIPVHVDTSIKVGHEKPFIGGERQFLIQQAIRSVKRSDDPIFAVVPTIDATEFQIEGADGVLAIPNDDFNAELNLSAKWNAGLDWAEKQAREAGNDRWNVAILNDDIEVDPDFLARLANGLRSTDNAWIAYPNIHGIDIPEGTVVHTESNALAGQTMSGYAFMVKGESGLRADEQFRWWYGDSDLERQVREAGKKTVCVGGCHLRHLHPMESSRRPELLALARGDELRFAGKWDLDVKSLWLNQNPEFGS